MDGVHDLGGLEGYGPIPFTSDEPIGLNTRWEATAAAAMWAMVRSGRTNLDAHRHRIERLDPALYFSVGYFGRWLAAVEMAAIEQGVATPAEVADAVTTVAPGTDPAITAPPPRLHPVSALEDRTNAPGFLRAVGHEPRFAAGDRVQTLSHAPNPGHHRLPRYARGKTGTIARVYPAFTFPDTMAHGGGENPQFVYAVAFSGTDLWGPNSDQNQTCHLDVFEPYLQSTEPAKPNEVL